MDLDLCDDMRRAASRRLLVFWPCFGENGIRWSRMFATDTANKQAKSNAIPLLLPVAPVFEKRRYLIH